MATPKGAKFTEEHVANIMSSRAKSEKWRRGREEASKKMKGRKPSLAAIAGSLATRSLRTMELSRTSAPTLWEAYYQFHIKRLRDRREAIAA